MTDETCGYETVAGTPCQHDATESDGRCWQHTDSDDADPGGRPRAFDDEQTRQRVLVAAGQGLKIRDQANLAGVSTETLRRRLCCIETPSEPDLDPDPCEFCGNYARARANGAREVLQECRPEFVASASFGYVKEEKRELTGEDGGAIEVSSSVVTWEVEDE
jgi:endonuclease YncB( thermonuclease family)